MASDMTSPDLISGLLLSCLRAITEETEKNSVFNLHKSFWATMTMEDGWMDRDQIEGGVRD